MTDELRARGADLCMSDAMPFQQHWEHRTTWPLADVLNDKYFLNVRDQLRAGDAITICRYDGRDANHTTVQLLEVASVRIIACGRDKPNVPLVVIGEIQRVGKEVAGPGPLEVVKGKAGKYVLVRGEDTVEEFGSKAEAEAARKKLAA